MKVKLPNGQSVYGKIIGTQNDSDERTDEQTIRLEMPQKIKTPIGDLLLTKEIVFYGNGNFNKIQLYIEQEINTKYDKFLLNKEEIIKFYNNGNLKKVRLYGEKNVVETKYGKFPIVNYLYFNENGTVEEISLKNEEKISLLNTKFRIDSSVSFFDNGNIAKIQLSKPTAVKTKYGKLDFEKLYFHKNGEIEEGKFTSQTVKTISIHNKKTFIHGDITFHDNGNVKIIFLNKPTEIKTLIGKLKFEKSGCIYFYKNGNLEVGKLQESQIVNILNNKIVIDRIIEFHENGNLKTAMLPDRQIGYNKNGDEVVLYGKICLDENGNLEKKCE